MYREDPLEVQLVLSLRPLSLSIPLFIPHFPSGPLLHLPQRALQVLSDVLQSSPP